MMDTIDNGEDFMVTFKDVMEGTSALQKAIDRIDTKIKTGELLYKMVHALKEIKRKDFNLEQEINKDNGLKESIERVEVWLEEKEILIKDMENIVRAKIMLVNIYDEVEKFRNKA